MRLPGGTLYYSQATQVIQPVSGVSLESGPLGGSGLSYFAGVESAWAAAVSGSLASCLPGAWRLTQLSNPPPPVGLQLCSLARALLTGDQIIRTSRGTEHGVKSDVCAEQCSFN